MIRTQARQKSRRVSPRAGPLTICSMLAALAILGDSAAAQTAIQRPEQTVWPDPIGVSGLFGSSVSSEGGWVAVASPVDSNGAVPSAGSLTIYRRVGGQIELVAKRYPAAEPNAVSAQRVDVRDGVAVVMSSRALPSGDPEFRGQCSIYDLTDPAIPRIGVIRSDQRLVDVGAGTFYAAVVLDRDHVAVSVPDFDGLSLPGGGTPSRGAVLVYRRGASGWDVGQIVVPGIDFHGMGAPILDTPSNLQREIDFDGERLIVGARYGFTVYDWLPSQKLVPAAVVDGTYLNFNTASGVSVAIEGDLIAVGDWGLQNTGPFAARVHLYRESGGAWQLERTIYPSDGWQFSFAAFSYANSNFGRDIVIDERERVLVGAPLGQRGGTTTNPSAELPGTAYLFEKGPSGWEERIRFWHDYETHQSFHGEAVAFCGDLALVGAKHAPPPGSTAWIGKVSSFLIPIGSTVCVGEPNSTSERGSIDIVGDRDLAFEHLEVRASALPAGAPAMLLSSRDTAFVANPGSSSGNLCLGGSIARFVGSIDDADTAGEVRFTVADLVVPTPGGPETIEAGDTWTFQVWYRDSDPTPTSNFTEAQSVTFE